MPTRRQHRINELLFEALTLQVSGEAEDDPRLTDVLITRVETTQDLSNAKVYFTSDGDEAEVTEALVALKEHERDLRGELADLGLRRLPHLVFARDRAFESGERVLAILNRLNSGQGGG